MLVHNLRLIDNSYDFDIARELLNGLISQKIMFIENMINETNRDDQEEMKQMRIRSSDLRTERRSLDLLIEEHQGEHVEMEIGCTIVMSIKKIGPR